VAEAVDPLSLVQLAELDGVADNETYEYDLWDGGAKQEEAQHKIDHGGPQHIAHPQGYDAEFSRQQTQYDDNPDEDKIDHAFTGHA